MDKLARKYLMRRGFSVSQIPADEGDYALYRYESRGVFDYGRYKTIQEAGNKRKIGKVWADEVTIELICDRLRKSSATVRSGLCHGSRNGAEVRWFEKHLAADVVGTDISETASDHGLVQWDFHERREEWVGRFDFVYTNSHDHAYDPKKAFQTWVEQLAPGGRLIIEHSMAHSPSGVNELDPFGVDPRILPYVLLEFGEGRFAVTDMIRPPHKKAGTSIWVFFLTKV
ncbi:hypothetical protein GRZ55_07870 [Chelativorans sp. ZYF759]|uniref:class I SAM-dependent methyltransferase n=1 Tax=Chelativorans sp. ZYF759 TaxID=2692213 RepID=UPI00145E65D2|nr:methyltransferase domain-containing protein [Chelativorans sp. ZYF759]NMG39155.1 hypothetical protein [Chelativorans sp. ZYF759]